MKHGLFSPPAESASGALDLTEPSASCTALLCVLCRWLWWLPSLQLWAWCQRRPPGQDPHPIHLLQDSPAISVRVKPSSPEAVCFCCHRRLPEGHLPGPATAWRTAGSGSSSTTRSLVPRCPMKPPPSCARDDPWVELLCCGHPGRGSDPPRGL